MVLRAKYKDNVEDIKFFVVEPEVESVLSGNMCVKLGLLKRVHQLTSNPPLARTTVELDVYSPRNDPDPEMIPTFLLVDPEVIPKELENGD